MEYVLVALLVGVGITAWVMSNKKNKPLTPDEKLAQLQQLLNDKDQATYQKAIVVLGNFDHPQSPALLLAMLTDKRPKAASTALKVLLEKGADNLVEALTAAMGSLADGERTRIIEICGQKKVQGTAQPVVAPYLGSADPNLQKAAAEALGRLGDVSCIEALHQLMEQSVSYVQMASAFALVKLGDGRGWPTLKLQTREDERGTRTKLAGYLGEIGGPDAFQLLMELVRDRDHFVKAKAISALGAMGDASVVPVLLEGLGDYYEGVSKAAHKALVEMAGKDLGKDPAAWQQWLDQGGPGAAGPTGGSEG